MHKIQTTWFLFDKSQIFIIPHIELWIKDFLLKKSHLMRVSLDQLFSYSILHHSINPNAGVEFEPEDPKFFSIESQFIFN